MNPYEIEEVSSRIVKLARDAKSENYTKQSDELLRIAANLELVSPELQNCWGGPLNGQEGRRAIFQNLIDTIGFDAIFETGTYRGLTTAWFADHYSGPIYSCEIDKRYHYQAQSNLRERKNIHLSLEDSRQFLRRSLAAAPKAGRYFVYLDAHWHDDLPLAEEVQLILESGRSCVIAIDDFKVPGDDYKFDNYGPGKVIALDLLEQFKDDAIEFFFPKLAAAAETGAARGVCIIAGDLSSEVEKSQLLQGNSWTQWKNMESASDALRREASIGIEADGGSKDSEHELGHESEISGNINSQVEDMDTVKSGITTLLESQSSLQEIVQNFSHTLNEYLDAVDDRREIGRALVEQKAKNLELERQNYRLAEELHQLSPKNVELKHQNERLKRELQETFAASQISPAAMMQLTHVKNLVESLSKSRAINSVSIIAPKARQTVAQLAGRLDQLMRNGRP